MQRLLLVEDHASFRQTLALVFDQQPDFEVVGQAGSLDEARRLMRGREADMGVIDLVLPDGEGVELIEELHDVVLQDLTYALQSLQVVQRMPEAVDRGEEAARQVEALKRAVGGLRDVIYELRLQSAQEQPLIRTLESIVELNRQMAPECAFELVVDGEFPASLSGPAGLEVARIVQEALANVRRHSGARRATVTLRAVGDEARVEVEDDGRGLDPDEPPGMGLTGMRERALALGGTLQVEGERGAGTRVRLRVALPTLVEGYSSARK